LTIDKQKWSSEPTQKNEAKLKSHTSREIKIIVMKNSNKIMFIISLSVSAIALIIFIYTLLYVKDFVWWSGLSNGPESIHESPLNHPGLLFRAFFSIFFIPIILWLVTYFISKNSKTTENIENIDNTVINDSVSLKNNKTSIWGFTLSLIAMFTGLGLLAYIGMTCGIIGLIQIKKNKQKGKGLAITAIIIGAIYGIDMSLIHMWQIYRE
jgi:hypothetical protein